jgi:16S rRNA (uracil1498-N3)-methyltransferase
MSGWRPEALPGYSEAVPHIPRLYTPGAITAGPFTLPAEAAHRLASVMRLRPGDPCLLFGGDGREWGATIESTSARSVRLTVGGIARQLPASVPVIEAWIALVRPNRFDLAIEKCTEAGVDVIRPLICDFAARGEGASANRQERWDRIGVEAAEQSGRLFLPVIAPPAPFTRALESHHSGALVVCDRDGSPWPSLVPLLPESGVLAVAIGPEGGWSPAERAAAHAHGALMARLGPNILRTETAAIAAVVLARAGGASEVS